MHAGRVESLRPAMRRANEIEGDPGGVALDRRIVRRRPTLPQPRDCSTIGAERLNFRVRYGTGCFPFAMAAVTLWTNYPLVCGVKPVVGLLVGIWLVDACKSVLVCCPHPGTHGHTQPACGWCVVVWVGQALGLLVPVGWASLLYTSGLSTHCSGGGLTPSRGWETSS